jgi:hypothetical protein
MQSPSDRDRRQGLRVIYPNGIPRPRLIFPLAEYAIVDVGERSLKFALGREEQIELGQRVLATLVISDTETLAIEGTVLRRDADGVVLTLNKRLPDTLFSPAGRDRRAFFRLRYPQQNRPRLQVLGQAYEATEISEHGVRLCDYGVGGFRVGQMVQAALTFADGEVLVITGQVLRMEKEEVVLILSKGIPESRVMREQMQLIRKRT